MACTHPPTKPHTYTQTCRQTYPFYHIKRCFVYGRACWRCVRVHVRAFVCLQGSDPRCLVCFSIKRAVKEREQMAAGPLCPASSHNCHTSCASINLLSLLLQHNFIKTTQERANNEPAQLSGAKDRVIRSQKNSLGFLAASVSKLCCAFAVVQTR